MATFNPFGQLADARIEMAQLKEKQKANALSRLLQEAQLRQYEQKQMQQQQVGNALRRLVTQAEPGTGPVRGVDQYQQVRNKVPGRSDIFKELARIGSPSALEFAPEQQQTEGPYAGLERGYETFLRANQIQNSPQAYQKYRSELIELKKAGGTSIDEYPNVAKLLASGWFPSSGRLTKPLMQAIEQASDVARKEGRPFGPEEVRAYEFQSVKNRSTASSAGSRLTIARKQNIEAAHGLLKDLKATANKLNYSQPKFIASLEKWKNGQLQDPIFTEYMTQRADSLFILGNALKQNGLTDKSIEVEEEAFSPTLSPAAFAAWYNTQLRALNRAAREMNVDYKYNIPEEETYPAGQGGAPTKNEDPLGIR